MSIQKSENLEPIFYPQQNQSSFAPSGSSPYAPLPGNVAYPVQGTYAQPTYAQPAYSNAQYAQAAPYVQNTQYGPGGIGGHGHMHPPRQKPQGTVRRQH